MGVALTVAAVSILVNVILGMKLYRTGPATKKSQSGQSYTQIHGEDSFVIKIPANAEQVENSGVKEPSNHLEDVPSCEDSEEYVAFSGKEIEGKTTLREYNNNNGAEPTSSPNSVDGSLNVTGPIPHELDSITAVSFHSTPSTIGMNHVPTSRHPLNEDQAITSDDNEDDEARNDTSGYGTQSTPFNTPPKPRRKPSVKRSKSQRDSEEKTHLEGTDKQCTGCVCGGQRVTVTNIVHCNRGSPNSCDRCANKRKKRRESTTSTSSSEETQKKEPSPRLVSTIYSVFNNNIKLFFSN